MGIRQQSLTYHFPTKLAILEALLAEGLDEPLRVVREMRSRQGSPAARLYAYVRFDVTHLQQSPFELVGLYEDRFLRDPALLQWHRRVVELYEAVAAMVAEGSAAGVFLDLDAAYAASAVGALVERTMDTWLPYGTGTDVASFVADFCLRGMLADPSTLDRVRAEADSFGVVDRSAE